MTLKARALRSSGEEEAAALEAIAGVDEISVNEEVPTGHRPTSRRDARTPTSNDG